MNKPISKNPKRMRMGHGAFTVSSSTTRTRLEVTRSHTLKKRTNDDSRRLRMNDVRNCSKN